MSRGRKGAAGGERRRLATPPLVGTHPSTHTTRQHEHSTSATTTTTHLDKKNNQHPGTRSRAARGSPRTSRACSPPRGIRAGSPLTSRSCAARRWGCALAFMLPCCPPPWLPPSSSACLPLLGRVRGGCGDVCIADTPPATTIHTSPHLLNTPKHHHHHYITIILYNNHSPDHRLRRHRARDGGARARVPHARRRAAAARGAVRGGARRGPRGEGLCGGSCWGGFVLDRLQQSSPLPGTHAHAHARALTCTQHNKPPPPLLPPSFLLLTRPPPPHTLPPPRNGRTRSTRPTGSAI